MSLRLVYLIGLGTLLASPLLSQYPPGMQGSPNMKVISHIPVGGGFHANDLEIEQDLSRPFAYVSRRSTYGFHIIDLKEPSDAKVIYSWEIENPGEHRGRALDNKYFKVNGRYYDVQAFQFRAGSADRDLGAIVYDVNGLPDSSTVRELHRIRAPDTPGGFHNIFMYKHSTGRALLFATVNSPLTAPHGMNIYDMELLLGGAPNHGLVGRIPLPEPRGAQGGYHDAYVGYDPVTRKDRFFGGGPEVTRDGGYYVWDVSDPSEPQLLASIIGAPGMTGAHTFNPTPDGRYVITKQGGQNLYRIFDLQPAYDGEVKNVTRPIGAWTVDIHNPPHQTEVRWPYAFSATYEDGLHVFNLMDPTNPYTVAYYDTFDGPHAMGSGGPGTLANGAFGVDVRNADGLIVIADMTTGFWALKMDGFDSWNGHQWGMPNQSSAQDWDNGPDGAPKPVQVS